MNNPFPTYQCDECGQTLPSIRKLKDHMLKQHDPAKFYKCCFCDRIFIEVANLVEHQKVHHVSTCGVTREELHKDYVVFRSSLLPHQVNPPLPSTSFASSSHPPPPPPPLPHEEEEPEDQIGIQQIGGALLNDATRLEDILNRNRGGIKSYTRKAKVLDIANFEVITDDDEQSNLDTIPQKANAAYDRLVTSAVKVNCSPGFILKHKQNGTLRYFHSSANNLSLFDTPRFIRNRDDFQRFTQEFQNMDIMARLNARRPNTQWRIYRLTNITFYFYKQPSEGIGSCDNLPLSVRNNKWLISLDKNRSTGQSFQDNLCFFRALAILTKCKCTTKHRCRCRCASELQSKALFKKWKEYSKSSETITSFPGVTENDFMDLEKCFEVNIRIFAIRDDGVGTRIWSGETKPAFPNLNLYQFENHFCYIKNVDSFVHHFRCEQCQRSFSKYSNLKRHNCEGKASRLQFPNHCYRAPVTIFDEIFNRTGLKIEGKRLFYPYRITYDIETFMEQDNLPTSGMNFTSQHRLMSISACSNIPDFDEAICFVTNGQDEELIKRFVNYLDKCHETATERIMKTFEDVFIFLEEFEKSENDIEERFLDKKFAPQSVYNARQISKLTERLKKYLSIVPVIGFNSSSYDLNVMKATLLKHLQLESSIEFVVKRETRLQCVQTNKFKFLDMLNYLTPGTSYEKYLKAYGITNQKGYFPYEYITSLDKLMEKHLPPHEAFYSKLKNCNISLEEYEFCQQVWKENRMETLKDFLCWYNNLDVAPFLEAIEKQVQIYQSKGIDMFKHHISIPGIAVQWKFHEMKKQAIDIPLITFKNKDLFQTVKDNIVGGPSIIFSRHHEKNLTKIRPYSLTPPKTCQNIIGFDANALYLSTFMQDMPTGSPIRRRAERNFTPEFSDTYGRKAFAWLEYVAVSEGIKIQHKFNNTEFRVGQFGLPVDGYCEETSTIYQFHGCAFHGHKCKLTKNLTSHPFNGKTFDELEQETKEKELYIHLHGFHLKTIKECEWGEKMKSSPYIKSFVAKVLHREMSHYHPMTETSIIEGIKHERFFGLIECDIEVPKQHREKFSEMTPIFKNVKVSADDLMEPMKTFAIENGKLAQPQRMLIGSYFGKKILLMTPLAKWYLEHGLVITKVYQIVQYKPQACFKTFANAVTNARREGDVDESKALLADISKLIGNSVYGKTITNKEKHRKIVYECDSTKASKLISSNNFLSLEEIDNDFYEIVSHKPCIKMDTPVVLGFCILQYAKLRMLQFYYDCIDKFIDRSDFEYCEMDTDSAYIALSDSFERVIKPELREKFWNDYQLWFPRKACSKHHYIFVKCMLENKTWTMEDCCKQVNKFDQRTPGLFKEEFIGTGIISLNSKTYYCWDENTNSSKSRAKGLKKCQNDLSKDIFLHVLNTTQSFTGTNRGFICRNSTLYTYQQNRAAVNYGYFKRHVLDDGKSTIPLHL